jgi:hypothetical protein
MDESQDPSESAVIRHQIMQLMEADMNKFYRNGLVSPYRIKIFLISSA